MNANQILLDYKNKGERVDEVLHQVVKTEFNALQNKLDKVELAEAKARMAEEEVRYQFVDLHRTWLEQRTENGRLREEGQVIEQLYEALHSIEELCLDAITLSSPVDSRAILAIIKEARSVDPE